MSESLVPIISPGRISTGRPDVDRELNAWADRLIRAVRDAMIRQNSRFQAAYTITNDTENRTYNADSTSTAELADILATLISDLRMRG